MKYKYLLWDVDGTLLDFPYSQRIAIQKCLEGIGVTATEEMITRYSEINDSWWKRLELGEVTKEQLLPGRFTELFDEFGIQCGDIEAFRRQYQENLGNVYKYLDHSLDICKKLQGEYYQYVVTNGVTCTQENKLKLAGFTDIMEQLFISEQIGAPKPQKAFFDYCFNRIAERHEDFQKSQVLIIGDSLSSDIKGGINAGIDTCWYNPKGESNTEGMNITYEIQELNQLLKILGAV